MREDKLWKMIALTLIMITSIVLVMIVIDIVQDTRFTSVNVVGNIIRNVKSCQSFDQCKSNAVPVEAKPAVQSEAKPVGPEPVSEKKLEKQETWRQEPQKKEPEAKTPENGASNDNAATFVGTAVQTFVRTFTMYQMGIFH